MRLPEGRREGHREGAPHFMLVDITISEQLWIKFDIAPSVGHIGLPLGTLADLNRQYRLDEFDSLQYCHDGSEAGFQIARQYLSLVTFSALI